MVRFWFMWGLAAVALLGASGSALGQGQAETTVKVDFLEPEVLLGAGQNVTTPLRVSAELQCQPGLAGPDAGIAVWGVHGISLSGPDGYIFESKPAPAEVAFEEGPDNTYVIDEVVSVRFWSTVPAENEINRTTHYSTHFQSSSDSCTVFGWAADEAEAASIVVRVAPADAHAPTQESGSLGALFAVVVCTALAHVCRRGQCKR